VYEGSTTADGAGNWTFDGSLHGPNVTATATDAAGNTSEFSAPVAFSPAVGGIFELHPDALGLARSDASGSSIPYAALGGAAAAGSIVVAAAGWYVKRRQLGR
jgi:hypothetical protein